MSFQKFLGYYILLIIISSGLAYSGNQFIFDQKMLIPHFWGLYAFMAFITLLVYLASTYALKLDGEFQSYILLGAVVVRFLGSLIILLFYLLKNKVDSVLFMSNFFSIYLLFTVFEIYCLLRNLRHQIRK